MIRDGLGFGEFGIVVLGTNDVPLATFDQPISVLESDGIVQRNLSATDVDGQSFEYQLISTDIKG